MMRLNPEYLKSYTPEDVDAMEWEALESAMALWGPHFHVAISGVLAAERWLCARVLAPLPPAVWPECFAKIAARIAAAFFRFADGVAAAAAREPQRLFRLLDMLDAVAREGPPRRALLRRVGHAARHPRARARGGARPRARRRRRVLRVRPPRRDALRHRRRRRRVRHVPKIVRYAVNYLKCLASDDYRGTMDAALRASAGDDDGGDSEALAEAASNVLEALHRHVEAARRALPDAVASHVMAMNSYWYIYMRARGSELASLVGDDTMRRRYKASAEEAAWEYQDAAWGPLVRLVSGSSSGAAKAWPSPEEAREKAAAFADALEERARRHGAEYKIPDGDLREQIKAAAAKAVRGAYAGFLRANDSAVASGGGRREFLPVDAIEGMVRRVFDEMGDGGGVAGSAGRTRSRRQSGNLEGFEG